jgi:hypothetical protein
MLARAGPSHSDWEPRLISVCLLNVGHEPNQNHIGQLKIVSGGAERGEHKEHDGVPIANPSQNAWDVGGMLISLFRDLTQTGVWNIMGLLSKLC